MPSGILYIIPSPIHPDHSSDELPPLTTHIIRSLKVFVCEDSKTTRKVIKNLDPQISQSALEVAQINKHRPEEGLDEYIQRLLEGEDIGFMSEAGLPGVADPGSLIVKMAHEKGIPVKCMPGSSSLVMALSGSGLNGQKFCFQGYLPREKDQRMDSIKKIEKLSSSQNSSQLLIETPYRNDQLLNDLVKALEPKTLLCVAAGLNTESADISTRTVEVWARGRKTIGKIPAVFILYAGNRDYLT